MTSVLRPPSDPDRLRETVEEVLSDPAFETEPSVLDRLIDRFFAAIDDLFGQAIGSVLGQEAVAWVVAGIAVAILGVAVWRWTRGLRIDGRTAPEIADPAGRSAADWLDEAREARERGELSLALRRYYLSLIAVLEERGVLEPLPGRTIRELDRELARRRPDLVDEVSEIGGRVERVVFGGRRAGEDDVERAAQARDHLATTIGAGR